VPGSLVGVRRGRCDSPDVSGRPHPPLEARAAAMRCFAR
jgi:hypothetical protein